MHTPIPKNKMVETIAHFLVIQNQETGDFSDKEFEEFDEAVTRKADYYIDYYQDYFQININELEYDVSEIENFPNFLKEIRFRLITNSCRVLSKEELKAKFEEAGVAFSEFSKEELEYISNFPNFSIHRLSDKDCILKIS
jgi:hypothetical protein